MSSIGPQLPPHLLNANTTKPESESEEEDDYGPALPPELAAARTGPSVVKGPSFPTVGPDYDDDDDDDDVGPKPLPSGYKPAEEEDGVKKFMELERKRREKVEEAKQPKALKREEWMLVPPSSSELLGNIDPTKLTKGRQFSKSTAAPRSTDTSLWTETPAERQQRLADEVSGRKRRAVNSEDTGMSAEEQAEMRKRQKRDEEIRKTVDAHTKNMRGAALVDVHTAKLKEQPDDNEPKAIWDHSRDMAIGGRLMDDSARSKMVKDAKSLSSRFGTGSSGGYL